MLSALGLLACLACPPLAGQHDVAVDVELVLAVDVSRSMDEQEFALQRAGYVEALRHPDFVSAIRSGHHGRIAVAYYEWAGLPRLESLVTWQVIDSPETAERFARKIAERPFSSFLGTSISRALDYGAALFEDNGVDGLRRVIDISGDGPNNQGEPVTASRDLAVARGIIINGLPIMIRPSPTYPEIDRYYAECVIGGPGSFTLPIRSADEFSTAIRRKLILEVSDDQPDPAVTQAAGAPVNCLKGEQDRRITVDPYFQELDAFRRRLPRR
jgi:hypothetical protein